MPINPLEMSAFIDPKLTTPHYSTRLYRAYYGYLSSHHKKGLFDEAAASLGVPTEYLLQDDNWVSVEFAKQFVGKLIQLTGDPDLPRKVGREVLRPENVNPFELALVTTLPPFLIIARAGARSNKLNRIATFKTAIHRPGRVLFNITYSTTPPPHVCANTNGVMEAFQSVWNLDRISVKHDICVTKGSDHCEVDVRYSARAYWKKALSSIFGLILVCTAIYEIAELAPPSLWNLFTQRFLFISTLATTAILATMGVRLAKLFQFSAAYHEQSAKRFIELNLSQRKLDRRYQEANLLRELSLNLVRETNPTKLIDSVLTEIEKRFGYGRTMVMLVSPDQKRLYTADVRGFGKFSELIHKLQFAYPAEKDNQQLFANILERGETTFIENMDDFIKSLKPENQVLLMALGINSMVIAPIQDANLKYGLMIVGETGDPKRLGQDDRHLMENIARLFSVYFQNARNFEKESTLRTIFQKYVPAVVLEGIQALTTTSGTLLPKDNFITSFFIDLRDFTTKSEGMAPEKVVELLNYYFNYVSKLVSDEGGIVDNLIGDALVAFFPAEEKRRTLHAGRAMRAALQILSGLDSFNTMLKAKGFAEIQVGIGIHTGKATVGSIGSEHKLNYTAIGDTVNVASRLQGLCKKMETRTPNANRGVAVVSDQTFLRARVKTDFLWIGPQTVKGRKESINSVVIDTAMAKAALESNLLTWSDDEHEGIAEKLGIGVAGEPSIDRRSMKETPSSDDESGNQEAA